MTVRGGGWRREEAAPFVADGTAMRRWLRSNIPSMFHRRLLLLSLTAVLVTAALGGQAVRLTTGAMHERQLQAAESALRMTTYIPTVRGRLLDRHGRPLAEDQPGYDVAVDYSVIAGDWAFERGYQRARRYQQRSWSDLPADVREAIVRAYGGSDSRARQRQQRQWSELSPHDREALIAVHREPYDRQVATLWQTLSEVSGVSLEEIERRGNAIREQVVRDASVVTLHNQRRRIEALDEPVSWADAHIEIREQRQRHSILRDVDEKVVSVVRQFIAEAERERDAWRATGEGDGQASEALRVWTRVELRRPKHRRYPFETMTVRVDRRWLPPPMREGEPLTVTVEGVGLHVLGQVRDVYREDVEANPFEWTDEQGRRRVNLSGYREGDQVGRSGVERYAESLLRGRRGKRVIQRDTGQESRNEPEPGRDVRLTIDVDLQAQVQGVLSPQVGLMAVQPWHESKPVAAGRVGEPLEGAAIVLEVESGDVLAAVSVPTMPLALLREQPQRIYRDPLRLPYINRVVARPYLPGSTIKPLMLVSAVAAGAHRLHDPIECRGVLDPDHPEQWRCWVFKRYRMQHGPLGAAASLEVSCNIYYYTLGQRMGLRRTADWYGRFGLGMPTDCGLPEEIGGHLPRSDDARFSSRDAINMGIGQGPVDWSPMQAAAAYATLARGGRYVSPSVVADEDRLQPRRVEDLKLTSESIREALDGLHDVVHGSRGTARALRLPDNPPIFDVEGVAIDAKSGTADPGDFRWVDKDFDGLVDRGERLGEGYVDDHAWCIALVTPEGATRPTHVVAVVTEFAGSGSQVSGPIVNAIVHAMRDGGWLR